MSKLETNTIDTLSGTSNLTIGSTNSSTVTFENGSCTGQNFPAFFAYSNADQTVTDATQTKVQFQTQEFDTDGAFDNSTNYRFTVPTGKAGKYYVTTSVYFEATSGIDRTVLYLFKNGNQESIAYWDLASGDFRTSPVISVILNLSAGDYLEVYGTLDSLGGTPKFKASSKSTYFGAYRIGA